MWTDGFLIPILSQQQDVEILDQLNWSPKIRSDRKDWLVCSVRELEYSQEDLVYIENPESTEGLYPIYNGGSYNTWIPDTGDYYAWCDKDEIVEYVFQKRQRLSSEKGSILFEEKFERERTCFPRISYRNVARSTDPTTLIVSLVPSCRFLTSKAPYLYFKTGTKKDEAYLLGMLSSIVLDWQAKRYVDLSVNIADMANMAIPRIGCDDTNRMRIEAIVASLLSKSDHLPGIREWISEVSADGYYPTKPTEHEAQILKDELNAIVALAFGLSRCNLGHIFQELRYELERRGKEDEEGKFTEERAAKALEYFDALS